MGVEQRWGRLSARVLKAISIPAMTVLPTNHEPIDFGRAAEVSKLVGPARMVALLDILSARLEAIADAIMTLHSSRDDIIASVHQSQGSAGSLGLTELMLRLNWLETELTADGGCAFDKQSSEVTALLAAFKTARQAMKDRLPQLIPPELSVSSQT